MKIGRMTMGWLALFLVVIAAARGEARLMARVAGESLPVAGFEDGKALVVRNGNAVREERDLVLEIEDDEEDGVRSYFSLLPDYEVTKKAETGWTAVVRLGSGSRYPDSSERWNLHARKGAFLVLGWRLRDRITKVRVSPLLTGRNGHASTLNLGIVLDVNEAGGQPVMMLWMDGHFVPPLPLFADARIDAVARGLAWGDNRELPVWLARNKSPADSGVGGFGLMHVAAATGNLEGLKQLITAGAAVDIRADRKGPTPLHLAVARGRAEAVKMLLTARADPNLEDEEGNLPIHLAVSGGQEEIARDLIEAGTRLLVKNGIGEDAVTVAIDRDRPAIGRLLVENYARYDFSTEKLRQMLLEKVISGKYETVKWLLDEGVKVNPRSGAMTPLAAAVELSDDGRMARLLVEHGARVDRSGEGMMPLERAARADQLGVAKVLIEAGANVNERGASGETALHAAAAGDKVDMVRYLLSVGANAGLRTKEGDTPLDVALCRLAPRAVAALAEAGNSLSVSAAKRDELIDAALRFDRADLIVAAMAEGWKAETPLYGRWAPEWVAVWYGARQCLEKLAGDRAQTVAAKWGERLQMKIDSGLEMKAGYAPEDPRDPNVWHEAQTVMLRVVIDREGVVRFPVALDGADAKLSRFALLAMDSWRTVPPRSAGQPADTATRLPVDFPAMFGGAYDVSQIDVAPEVIERPSPAFPPALKRSGAAGEVKLQFVVNEEGNVEQISVLSASHEAFAKEAVKAVGRWRFHPGERNGKPVRTLMVLPLAFTRTSD